jgi:hypothetical protein
MVKRKMSNSSPAKSSLYNWVDITNEFKSNCQQLNIGQLVKEDQLESILFRIC